MDPKAHARFLEYRERHVYFARAGAPTLSGAEFQSAYAELTEIEALKEDERTDEQEARTTELRALLFMD